MLAFLPPRIQEAVRHLNENLLYELRIRADKPLRVWYGETYCYLGKEGISGEGSALIPTPEEVQECLFAASGYSVYAVENQIRQGFVTAEGGYRLGIAGTAVYDGGKLNAIRDVTSLCVRIPHEVRGCAEEIYKTCLADGVRSLLIMSPPGEGKTTILRDLCRLISERTKYNLLVGDERGELSAGDLGATADVLRFADKQTAFTAGIRALRPDVIVTDELLGEDYAAVRRARESGISVLASAHLVRYDDVPAHIFDRYVLINGLGHVGEILDGEGKHVA